MRRMYVVVILLVVAHSLQNSIACQYVISGPYLYNLRLTEDYNRFLVELQSHNSSEKKNLIIDTKTQKLDSPSPEDKPANLSIQKQTTQAYQPEFLFLENETYWALYDENHTLLFNVSLPMSETAYWQFFVSERLARAFIVFTESEYDYYLRTTNGVVIPINNETDIRTFTVQWDFFYNILEGEQPVVYDDEQIVWNKGESSLCVDGYYYRFSNSGLEYIIVQEIWSESVIDSRVKRIVVLIREEDRNKVVFVDYNISNKITLEKMSWSQEDLDRKFYFEDSETLVTSFGRVSPSSANLVTFFPFSFFGMLLIIVFLKKRRRFFTFQYSKTDIRPRTLKLKHLTPEAN